MTFDPSGDFLAVVDGLAAVALKDRAGVKVVETDPSALRRAIGTREAEKSNGKYRASDVRFHFETSAAGAGPELGGTITEGDGTVWSIVETAKETLGVRWACVCRRLSLPACSLLSVERAAYAKGTTGAQEPTFSVVFENLAGYVHWEGSSRDVANERRHNRRTGTAFFASPVDLNAEDRIVDANGLRWRVVEWTKPELGELMTVSVEEGPWPFA